MKINKVHHIAIICSDREKSKAFYTGVLGCMVGNEAYRNESQSYKIDLYLNGEYVIELFSFPHSPQRISHPEATGLRHLAFEVDDIESCVEELKTKGVEAEPVRIDQYTNKKFTFISDPDNLPIELYES